MKKGKIKKKYLGILSWFANLEEGQIVYAYTEPTDDCLQNNFVAITISEQKGANFFGVPKEAVQWDR